MGCSEVKKELKKYQIRPSKGLGQNFLIGKSTLKKILEAANLQPGDKVLEIGPGLGVLTREIAKRVKEVMAVEKDEKMCEILKELLEGWNVRNVKVICGDILKIDNLELSENWKLKIGNYKIVANLPFYITSPVIRKFLELENPPTEMVLMVQKEVAQRICTRPPKMNLLAVSVQFYAKPEIISFVSKKFFWPQPKVDSAIIKITPYKSAKIRINPRLFFKIVKAGFSQPRKQLLNNLSKGLKLDKDIIKSWLLENNIQPDQRAETLNIEDWVKLATGCGYNL